MLRVSYGWSRETLAKEGRLHDSKRAALSGADAAFAAFGGYRDAQENDVATTISDVLANLAHLCDLCGVSVEAAFERGVEAYRADVAEDGRCPTVELPEGCESRDELRLPDVIWPTERGADCEGEQKVYEVALCLPVEFASTPVEAVIDFKRELVERGDLYFEVREYGATERDAVMVCEGRSGLIEEV